MALLVDPTVQTFKLCDATSETFFYQNSIIKAFFVLFRNSLLAAPIRVIPAPHPIALVEKVRLCTVQTFELCDAIGVDGFWP